MFIRRIKGKDLHDVEMGSSEFVDVSLICLLSDPGEVVRRQLFKESDFREAIQIKNFNWRTRAWALGLPMCARGRRNQHSYLTYALLWTPELVLSPKCVLFWTTFFCSREERPGVKAGYWSMELKYDRENLLTPLWVFCSLCPSFHWLSSP